MHSVGTYMLRVTALGSLLKEMVFLNNLYLKMEN